MLSGKAGCCRSVPTTGWSSLLSAFWNGWSTPAASAISKPTPSPISSRSASPTPARICSFCPTRRRPSCRKSSGTGCRSCASTNAAQSRESVRGCLPGWWSAPTAGANSTSQPVRTLTASRITTSAPSTRVDGGPVRRTIFGKMFCGMWCWSASGP